jgi:hypothetical protein
MYRPTARDQIAELIQANPGITGSEIHVFFKGQFPRDSISAHVSTLYQGGNYRRERAATSIHTYAYWYEPGAVPEARKPQKQHARLKLGNSANPESDSNWYVQDLKERISILEQWKAEAIRRYPDLSVPEITLKARKLAAAQFPADKHTQNQILTGCMDNQPLMLGIISALESVI